MFLVYEQSEMRRTLGKWKRKRKRQEERKERREERFQEHEQSGTRRAERGKEMEKRKESYMKVVDILTRQSLFVPFPLLELRSCETKKCSTRLHSNNSTKSS